MDNQHRQIKGARELDQKEIDLMNEVKMWEKQGHELMARVSTQIANSNAQMVTDQERAAFEAAQPARWLSIGRTHIQQGCMAIVRAIARPSAY